MNNIDKLETYYTKKLQIENKNDYVSLESIPKELATPSIISGRLPENSDEVALVDSLAS